MTCLSPSEIKQGLAASGVQNNLDTLVAILLAESSGCLDISNPSGAFGLGQFTQQSMQSLGLTPQDLLNPQTAFSAIAKWSNYGNSLTPWDAYGYVNTPNGEQFVGWGNGSYKQFLGQTNSTSPISNYSSSGISVGGVPQSATLGLGLGGSGLLNSLFNFPQLQQFTRRIGIFVVGGLLLFVGFIIVANSGSGKTVVQVGKGYAKTVGAFT